MGCGLGKPGRRGLLAGQRFRESGMDEAVRTMITRRGSCVLPPDGRLVLDGDGILLRWGMRQLGGDR